MAFSLAELKEMQRALPVIVYDDALGASEDERLLADFALSTHAHVLLANQYSSFSTAIHMIRLGMGIERTIWY